jgi:serine/threonine protein kinase
MGTVYLAIDTQLNRQVALKVPTRSEGSELPARMRQEARAAADLNHRGICAVYDVGSFGNTHFITMEYVEGTPLSRRLKGNKWMPVAEAVPLIRTVAKALAYAHEKGVVHRDLKSANIMIRPNGEPVVMDFGLARRSDEEGSRLTQDGEVLGTMTYMPPEQLCGDLRRIGPHSDVYSLACILFETLTGHIPFDGSPVEIILKINNQEPRSLGELQPHLVDSPLDAVIQKAMAKRTSNRYQTMTEFEEALAAATGQKVASSGSKVGVSTEHGDRRADRNTVMRHRLEQTRSSMPAIAAGPPPARAHRPEPMDSAELPEPPKPQTQAEPPAIGPAPPDSGEPHFGCKVFAPLRVHRSTSVPIQVFAFPSESNEQAMATQYDDATEQRGSVFLPFDPKVEQTLSFELVTQSGEVSESVLKMTWLGNVDSVQFTLTVPPRHPYGPLPGTVLVSSDDVPIGRIEFQLTVVGCFRRVKREPEAVALTAARFR